MTTCQCVSKRSRGTLISISAFPVVLKLGDAKEAFESSGGGLVISAAIPVGDGDGFQDGKPVAQAMRLVHGEAAVGWP